MSRRKTPHINQSWRDVMGRRRAQISPSLSVPLWRCHYSQTAVGILPTDLPCVSTVSCEEPVKNVQVLNFYPNFPFILFFFLPPCQASDIKCFHKYSRLKDKNVSVVHLSSDKYQPRFIWTCQCVNLLNIFLVVSSASVIYITYINWYDPNCPTVAGF